MRLKRFLYGRDYFEEEKCLKYLKEEEYLKKNILKRESVKNRTFSRKNFDRVHNGGRWTIKNYLIIIDIRL